VFGEDDKETPLYMAKKLAKEIRDSKLLIIQRAGHFCFVDRPHKFNTEVREFLLSKE
jgi:pimeloyl-ACP methyl ester carboxylesterase